MNLDALPWQDSQNFKEQLAANGWRSPDTYTGRFFEPFPENPGIYLFLVHDADLSKKMAFKRAFVGYVGMAMKLNSRLLHHPVYEKIFRSSHLSPVRWFLQTSVSNAQELRSLERKFIRHFDPPFNVQGRRPLLETLQ